MDLENLNNQQEEKGKTGVVPNEEISGSDADKAYDEEGNFYKQKQTGEGGSEKSDSPEGSDAEAVD